MFHHCVTSLLKLCLLSINSSPAVGRVAVIKMIYNMPLFQMTVGTGRFVYTDCTVTPSQCTLNNGTEINLCQDARYFSSVASCIFMQCEIANWCVTAKKVCWQTFYFTSRLSPKNSSPYQVYADFLPCRNSHLVMSDTRPPGVSSVICRC